MKKFIAALLSALVGVFGYTITDTAVEDRISKLEAEVSELREGSDSGSSTANQELLEVGDYIEFSPYSNSKFLLRENANGDWEYIQPINLDEIKENDVFVYVTDTVCQVKNIETVTHSVEYGINYEPSTISIKSPVVSLSFKGSAPVSLAGKQIIFKVSLATPGLTVNAITQDASCVVASDGSFSFNGELTLSMMSSDVIMNLYHYQDVDYIENLFENAALSPAITFAISNPQVS